MSKKEAKNNCALAVLEAYGAGDSSDLMGDSGGEIQEEPFTDKQVPQQHQMQDNHISSDDAVEQGAKEVSKSHVSQLFEMWSKNRVDTKGFANQFQFEEAYNEKGNVTSYIASLMVADMTEQVSGEPGRSKKDAKNNCAAAILRLYGVL